jgi:hypothetical protein
MLRHNEPLPAVSRGEKAGRLAAREMIRSAKSETGGLQGVMRRLEGVEIIVAERHEQAGVMAAEVQSWRIGFRAGIGLELREHMRHMRMADFRPSP